MKVQKIWPGIMGFSGDVLPWIGEAPPEISGCRQDLGRSGWRHCTLGTECALLREPRRRLLHGYWGWKVGWGSLKRWILPLRGLREPRVWKGWWECSSNERVII